MNPEERRINLRVTPDLHRRLKSLAALKEKTLLDFCREVMERAVESEENGRSKQAPREA